jgi:putative colanic acid biosynthesis acetyltransferase WcaF
MERAMYQDLSQFSVPAGFRGRSKWFVQCWWIAQALLFKPSPQFAYGFRAWLLRRFGANVGRNTVIRPTVTITYPWKVSIGDYAWIGDHAVLYSLGEIRVGEHAVVSQGCYLCAGDHDATLENFPIRARDIRVADQAWVASDVFVGPGVTIGRGAIVGARSSVFADMPEGMVCFGHPCQPVRRRVPKPE